MLVHGLGQLRGNLLTSLHQAVGHAVGEVVHAGLHVADGLVGPADHLLHLGAHVGGLQRPTRGVHEVPHAVQGAAGGRADGIHRSVGLGHGGAAVVLRPHLQQARRLGGPGQLDLLANVLVHALRELRRNLLARLLHAVGEAVGEIVHATLHVVDGLVDLGDEDLHLAVEHGRLRVHLLCDGFRGRVAEVLHALKGIARGGVDVIHGAVCLGHHVAHAVLHPRIHGGDALVEASGHLVHPLRHPVLQLGELLGDGL
mmetsp:Transcript_6087/g.19574  ORF Transcript_6087/g.19574 Transcript_6087/m.19574 type:complete len:256 (+) Transcript_6087:181-948(+)